MAINLDAVRNRLKNLQSTTKNRNNLWKPEVGVTKIRIVPYAYNKDNPFIELYFHYNVAKKPFLSLETFGEEDPIVEFSQKLKETGNKDDWKLGHKLEPTLRAFVPIVVRGKEKEGVKFWGFGKNIYKELLAIIADPDYGDITDPLNGRDIDVSFITPAEAGNNYGEVSIRVKPKETPVTDDEDVLDLIINKQEDIYTLYKKPTYDELKQVLENWLNPEEGEENSSEAKSSDDEDTEEKEAPVKKVVKEETNKVEATSTSTPKKSSEDVAKAFDALFAKKK